MKVLKSSFGKNVKYAVGGLALLAVAAIVAHHFSRKGIMKGLGAWAGGDIQTVYPYGKYHEGSRGAAGGGDIQTQPYPKAAVINVQSLDDYQILKYTLNRVSRGDTISSRAGNPGAYGGNAGTQGRTEAAHGDNSYQEFSYNIGPPTRLTPPPDILKDRKLIVASDNCKGNSFMGGLTLGYNPHMPGIAGPYPPRGNTDLQHFKIKLPLEGALSYDKFV